MEIDARGLMCPRPVIETKKGIDGGETEIIVFVDNPGAAENVARFARGAGFDAEITPDGGDLKITLKKTGDKPPQPVEISRCASISSEFIKGKALLIATDSLGRGSEELGQVLVKALLNALAENQVLPERIVLLNSGVKLACEGSDLLEALDALSSRGVEILACGTCLKHFGIIEKLRAGKVSNAFEILNIMLKDNIAAWY